VKEILEQINKVFENRIRLGVMSLLLAHDAMDFNSLKEQLDVTDGNLATHIGTLEKSAYIKVEKKFVGKIPRTTYSATRAGRKAFELHLDALEQLIKKHS
jgi:DNA-binding HxlR family transcriptional regulator